MNTNGLITLGICTAAIAIVGLTLILHTPDSALGAKRSPALKVAIDQEHGVLCWTNAHHPGMSCLPEWMLIPSRYDSISNISSANIGDQLNGQKDSTSP